MDSVSPQIKDICEQLATGNMKIAGVMIESHLLEGAQKLPDSKTLKEGEEVLGKLRYGVRGSWDHSWKGSNVFRKCFRVFQVLDQRREDGVVPD